MKTHHLNDPDPMSVPTSGVERAPEGARSATEGASSTPDVNFLPESRRWSCRRKLEVVQRLIGGESLEIVSRQIGVPIYQIEEWRDRALAGMESALKIRVQDPLEHQLKEAQRRIGEQSMEIELLYERCHRREAPFTRGKLRK